MCARTVEFLNRVHRLHSPHAARWVEPVRRQFVSLCHHHGMQSGRGQSERIMRRIMACGLYGPAILYAPGLVVSVGSTV